MRIPLVLVNRMLASASNFDALGIYLQTHIHDAFVEQYPDDVLLIDDVGIIVGSFGGASAFKHLPHRSIADNATRYGIEHVTVQCTTCNTDKLAICHRIPRAYGGNLSPHNLYLGCALCNARQRDVLTPQQLYALLPYAIHIPFSTVSMLDYVKGLISHE